MANTHNTFGGSTAHLMRRSIHILSGLLPFVYYHFLALIPQHLVISGPQLISAIIMINILIEAIRLRFRVILPGHRDYERMQPSSLAWGLLSMCMVILVVPGGSAYAIPIILGYALVDPLLGECRFRKMSVTKVRIIGLIALSAIWLLSSYFIGTLWWFFLFMAPITLAAEHPNLKYVDDNAMMQLIPLAICLILAPWLGMM